jgi:hypothetical protein
MNTDGPIVQQVRETASKISERFGHDLRRYCSYLRSKQQKTGHPVVGQVTVVQSGKAPPSRQTR